MGTHRSGEPASKHHGSAMKLSLGASVLLTLLPLFLADSAPDLTHVVRVGRNGRQVVHSKTENKDGQTGARLGRKVRRRGRSHLTTPNLIRTTAAIPGGNNNIAPLGAPVAQVFSTNPLHQHLVHHTTPTFHQAPVEFSHHVVPHAPSNLFHFAHHSPAIAPGLVHFSQHEAIPAAVAPVQQIAPAFQQIHQILPSVPAVAEPAAPVAPVASEQPEGVVIAVGRTEAVAPQPKLEVSVQPPPAPAPVAKNVFTVFNHRTQPLVAAQPALLAVAPQPQVVVAAPTPAAVAPAVVSVERTVEAPTPVAVKDSYIAAPAPAPAPVPVAAQNTYIAAPAPVPAPVAVKDSYIAAPAPVAEKDSYIAVPAPAPAPAPVAAQNTYVAAPAPAPAPVSAQNTYIAAPAPAPAPVVVKNSLLAAEAPVAVKNTYIAASAPVAVVKSDLLAAARSDPIAIIRSVLNAPDSKLAQKDGWNYSYETANGIKQESVGSLRLVDDTSVSVMKGSYEFLGVDNIVYKVEWYADQTGFHATAPHLPQNVVPNHPEVAAAVKAQIAFAAEEDKNAAASAGVITARDSQVVQTLPGYVN